MIGHDLGGHGSLHQVQIQGLRVARTLLVVRRHLLAMEASVQNLLHHRESTPAELQVKRDRLLAIESVGSRWRRHRVRRRPLRHLLLQAIGAWIRLKIDFRPCYRRVRPEPNYRPQRGRYPSRVR